MRWASCGSLRRWKPTAWTCTSTASQPIRSTSSPRLARLPAWSRNCPWRSLLTPGHPSDRSVARPANDVARRGSWGSRSGCRSKKYPGANMTKIEAIIQPNRFDVVKKALIDIGVEGMTVSEVRGHGRQKGHKESYRGGEYSVDLLPKVKLETVLQDNVVEAAVNAIITNASTGKIGDGKIFLYKVEEAIRIRSQERGAAAV